jgi:inner membrane transporter RhtA
LNDPVARVDVRTLGGAGFLLAGVVLVQWSAALVVPVFPVLGASATSAWRFLIGAVVLLVITRPHLRTWTRTQWIGAFALGVSTAFMNQCFYQALARIPLGGAVAIEFLGPLCVAALGRRSLRHFALVVLAGLGVLALTQPT